MQTATLSCSPTRCATVIRAATVASSRCPEPPVVEGLYRFPEGPKKLKLCSRHFDVLKPDRRLFWFTPLAEQPLPLQQTA